MIGSQDHQELISAWLEYLKSLHEKNDQFTSGYFEDLQEGIPISPTAILDVLNKTALVMMKHPTYLFEVGQDLLKTVSQFRESEGFQDKRFLYEGWNNSPYRLMKDHYLLTSKWMKESISHMKGLDQETKEKLEFYVGQFLDAISPSNFPFTNPEVMDEFINTGGMSLEKGTQTLLEDLATGHWINMTDPKAFKLGETLATTPGEVIYKNEIMELIHYTPLTEKQYEVPLLIIPPWINKFYIYDLSPQNSFVKWMLEQGHNVFIISWVNPKQNLASKNLEDYLFEGGYKACEVVADFAKAPKINTMGYCIGGNLLAILSAYLEKTPAPFKLASQTLIATIIDFSKIGDLKFFLDNENLEYIEHNLERNGFVDPERLKSIFSFLRPNELLWSFFIKNYLLGQTPPAFDFLYWNADGTRVPEALHKDVLRKFFRDNLLMIPGGLEINNIPIDLQSITIPTMFFSTLQDHIAPWKSTYPAVHQMKAPMEFVLGGSGHVAGVMNPPARRKYDYFTNREFPYSPDEWLDNAIRHEGSWWPHWHDWAKVKAGKKIKPQTMSRKSLGSAPGDYVKEA